MHLNLYGASHKDIQEGILHVTSFKSPFPNCLVLRASLASVATL